VGVYEVETEYVLEGELTGPLKVILKLDPLGAYGTSRTI